MQCMYTLMLLHFISGLPYVHYNLVGVYMKHFMMVSFDYNITKLKYCTPTVLLSATRDDTQAALITETYRF